MDKPEDIIPTIRKQAKAQKRNALIINVAFVINSVISLIVCFLGTIFLSFDLGPGLFQSTPSYFNYIILIIMYGSFFLIPFLLSLPFILPFAIRKKNTDRVIVFRKFNSNISRRSIRKIIRNTVANYGHVFTLSDSNFKIKWYVKIPVFLGQMGFFYFRPRSIKNEKDIKSLEKLLKQTGWLNVNWLLSFNKVFAVKTVDEQWQAAAKTLLNGSRLVIIDVSSLTASLDWEARITKETGLEKNIILIGAEDSPASALEWKNRYDEPDDYDIPLFYYNNKGVLTDKDKFEQSIAGILARDYPTNQQRYTGGIIKKTLLTMGAVISVFLVILYFMSPYLFPDFVARYSPFPKQAVKAYIQSKLKSSNDPEQPFLSKRLKSKWPLTSAALTVKYAMDHEDAECSAVAMAMEDLADPSQVNNYLKLAEQDDPHVSKTAFQILLKYPQLNRQELAFRLLSNDQLDVKERGFSILNRKDADTQLLTGLINTIGNDKIKRLKNIKPVNKDDSAMAQKEHTRIVKYYFNLYAFIDSNRNLLDEKMVEAKYRSEQNKDIRIILSLILLKFNNTAGITDILDSYFIDYCETYLPKGNTLYLFDAPPQPFKEVADSIFNGHKIFDRLPAADMILKNKQRLGNAKLPQCLIMFLLRNYPGIDLVAFNNNFEPVALAGGLHEFLANKSPDTIQRYRNVINANKSSLKYFLMTDSSKIRNRLNVAWLLANIGDISVAETAIQACKDRSWIDVSHEEEAIAILKALIKNTDGNFNRSALIALKDDKLSSAIQQLLDKLIKKGR